jgi:hypothetical protein
MLAPRTLGHAALLQTDSKILAYAIALALLIALCLLKPPAAFANEPVFCALSRLGLGAPAAEMKPRRSSAGECLFRVPDRRMYVEIMPLEQGSFDAMVQGGPVEGLPATARLMAEEKLVIDGRDVLLRSYTVPGAGQPRLWVIALSRFDDLPVMTAGVAQFVKLLSFSKEQLRATVLSTVARPPLTEAQYKKELPIDIADFAGFKVKSVNGATIKLEPSEAPSNPALPTAEVTISRLELMAQPNPQMTDGTLIAALESDLQLIDIGAVEKREIAQREGLDWFEFKAMGRSSRMPVDVFATAYLRMEPGKRIIRIEGLFPLETRAAFEARFEILAENIGG